MIVVSALSIGSNFSEGEETHPGISPKGAANFPAAPLRARRAASRPVDLRSAPARNIFAP